MLGYEWTAAQQLPADENASKHAGKADAYKLQIY